MPSKSTTVTYLQMFDWQPCDVRSPVPATVVKRLYRPTVSDYRKLYNGVGQAYDWTDRNRLDDAQLSALIDRPDIEIYQLLVAGQAAGFAELDVRDPEQIELVYFGLLADYIGRGLGKFLLTWILRRAWSLKPRRVWVHTCDLDHPAALPNYLKAGFQVYHQEVIQQRV